MRNRTRGRRGIASTLFVAMILLAAFTATSLTLLFAAELHRTRDGVIRAQQRQLLLAGAVQAQQAAANFKGGHEEHEVNLPAELGGRATLNIRLSNDDAAANNAGASIGIKATIKATIDGQSMRQTLMLLQAKDRTWKIETATLEGLQ